MYQPDDWRPEMKPLLSAITVVLLSSGIAVVGPGERNQSDDAASDPSEVIQMVQEWKVPFDDTRSRDPYVAPDGTVFFAGQRADYIGFFDMETESFDYHPLEDGTGPHTVVVGDDGTVWYAGNRARHIGRMDAATGEITRFMMDDDYARDPHTFAFNRDGNIWFTAQGGNGVGLFNVSTGETRVIPVPTERARPYGIRMAPDGQQPWVALQCRQRRPLLEFFC